MRSLMKESEQAPLMRGGVTAVVRPQAEIRQLFSCILAAGLERMGLGGPWDWRRWRRIAPGSGIVVVGPEESVGGLRIPSGRWWFDSMSAGALLRPHGSANTGEKS
jgi:hypothetical protein